MPARYNTKKILLNAIEYSGRNYVLIRLINETSKEKVKRLLLVGPEWSHIPVGVDINTMIWVNL